MKSREEIRFLALLNKSQEKAASLKNKESDKISAIIEDEWRVPKVIIFRIFHIFSSICSKPCPKNSFFEKHIKSRQIEFQQP